MEDLVIEILKDLQARMKRLDEGQTLLRVELSALGQQVAGLTAALYAGRDRMGEFERRLDRIERRLEINE